MVAALLGLSALQDEAQASHETASSSTNQFMLNNLGAALDARFDFLGFSPPKVLASLAGWLLRPPGARFDIDKPDKADAGAVPVIKLKLCKIICSKTNFPVVVNPK